jgi:hypothetical protein
MVQKITQLTFECFEPNSCFYFNIYLISADRMLSFIEIQHFL